MPLLNRHNLELAKLASASRFVINGIHVTPRETVVTDGHMMVVVSNPDMDAECFPVVQSGAVSNTWKPFNLDAKAVLDLAKHLPKKATIPVLACAGVIDGEETVTVVATDLEQEFTARAKRNGARFPDYERAVWDGANATFAITMNPAKLAAVLSHVAGFIGATTKANSGVCTIKFKNQTGAFRIEAKRDGQTLQAFFMPCGDERVDVQALESTPEIIATAKSGSDEMMIRAAARRDLLRAQLAELDAILS